MAAVTAYAAVTPDGRLVTGAQYGRCGDAGVVCAECVSDVSQCPVNVAEQVIHYGPTSGDSDAVEPDAQFKVDNDAARAAPTIPVMPAS